MKFNHPFTFSRSASALMFVALLMAAACSRHTTEIRQDNKPYSPRPRVEEPQDTRKVVVSGKVIGIPRQAHAPQQLMAGRILNEDELYWLTAPGGGAQNLVSPRMKVEAGDTGRFRLGIEGTQAAIRLELTPRIQEDGNVALHAIIETTGENGARDTLNRESQARPNSGLYQVFGPLAMDNQQVYAVLKADVLPQ